MATVLLLASCGGGDADADPMAAAVAIEASGCRRTPTNAIGTVVGEELVLTVAHAVAGETEIVVRTADGKRWVAVVAAIDTALDAAVLRVDGMEAGAVASRPYDDDDGDDVSLLLVREGSVSQVPVEIRRRVTIRTSDIYRQGHHLRPGLEVGAAVRSGDSGGGLLDADGHLVGIVWSASRQMDDRAWALTAEAVAPLIAAAAAGEPVPTTRCSR